MLGDDGEGRGRLLECREQRHGVPDRQGSGALLLDGVGDVVLVDKGANQVATTLQGITGPEHKPVSLCLISVPVYSALLLLLVKGRVCQLEQNRAGVGAVKSKEYEGYKYKK